MESLKILITGVTGFIGSNVASHLANENHEIYGLTRNEGYNWRLADQKDRIRLVRSDVSSYEKTYSAFEDIKPDGIINCSQYGAYPTEKCNRAMFHTNIEGLYNILDIGAKFNASWLINCGTSFEYAGSKENIGESVPSNPNSYYGVFKSMGTNMLDVYSKMVNTKLMTLRIFQAYGPLESKGRLVPYLLYNLFNNLDIHLNNPYLERDFTYIRDISGAFSDAIRAMDSLEKHETINIGTGTYTSIQEFANTGKNIIDSSSQITLGNETAKPEDRINRIVADVTKAKTLLKWIPKFQVSEGIKDFAMWLKDRLDYYKV
jgi:nucleoside-diphosphate-sugar epimerase